MSDTSVQQILVPENDALVGFGGDRTLEEDGSVILTIGQIEVPVTFLVNKINPNYEFVALYVSAIGQTTPAAIQAVPSIQTIYGFTVELSGAPDTALYVLHWHVKIIDQPELTPLPPPIPAFSFSPSASIIAGSTVYFNDLSTDLGGTITTWAWNFGDGNTSALQNPNHIFAAQGTYGVKLTVTDSNGVVQSVTKSVVIIAVPAASLSARVFNSTDTNIPSGVFTSLYFNSERWDDDNIHSLVTNTDRLTCQHAGKYIISACVKFLGGGGVGVRVLLLALNGVDFIAGIELGTGSLEATILELTTVYNLNVGDYVACQVYQNSGIIIPVTASPKFSPEFMMGLLGNLMISGPGAQMVSTSIVVAGGLIGADVIPVPLSLTSPPKLQGVPWFEKANLGDDNVYVVSIDSLTATGFNCNLSAPAIAGQILHVQYTQ